MSIKNKGKAIITSAVNKIVHFCLSGMAFSLTKSSKYFLYSFVPLNQISNFGDPFTKQNAARRNNGVVGKIGNTIPTIPKPTHKSPTNIKIQLRTVLIMILSLLYSYMYQYITTLYQGYKFYYTKKVLKLKYR